MQQIKKIVALLASSLFFAAYADTGNIHLDQSQNILFDTFSPNIFSLQVLQAKNTFNPNDVIFGGSAQFDAQHWQGDKIEEYPLGKTYEQGNGLYWTAATVDIMANVNRWSTVFLSTADQHIGRNDTDANNIYLPHAFLVLGNLDDAPFYVTTGINSIPFGVFAGSGPWDTPLTAAYFNPAQASQVSLAFSKNGWNGAATTFNEQTIHETHYAYNFFYKKDTPHLGYSMGAGYLTDLTLSNTNTAFNHPITLRRFPNLDIGDLGAIVDLNASLRYEALTFAAEYDKGDNKVNGNDYSPEAYALTANYAKTLFGKNTTFGLTHSISMHLKDVPTPLLGDDNLVSSFAGLKETWAINVSRPILKNTFIGLDLQRALTNAGNVTKSEAHTYTTTLDLTTYL